jgi:hypothetical protein
MPVNDPSKLRLKNAAVFMDTSSVSTKDDESYQLYTACNTDDGKLYFLDKDIASGCKSLLHALNVRENAVVGIYFSKRLLLFAIKDGKMQKPRFTSDDVSDPEYEISYTIKRWDLPENVTLEVYGHNIELGKLFDNIARTPVYLNRSAVYRARRAKEILLAASLVVMSLGVYLYMHLSNASIKKGISDLNRESEAISSKLQAEAVQRLPLYLSSSSIPIDAVFRSLSFLENCNYTAINITVDEAGNINTKVTAANPSDAHKIKSYVENPIINVTGGVIEIQFTKQSRISEYPEIPDGRNYLSYFNF